MYERWLLDAKQPWTVVASLQGLCNNCDPELEAPQTQSIVDSQLWWTSGRDGRLFSHFTLLSSSTYLILYLPPSSYHSSFTNFTYFKLAPQFYGWPCHKVTKDSKKVFSPAHLFIFFIGSLMLGNHPSSISMFVIQSNPSPSSSVLWSLAGLCSLFLAAALLSTYSSSASPSYLYSSSLLLWRLKWHFPSLSLCSIFSPALRFVPSYLPVPSRLLTLCSPSSAPFVFASADWFPSSWSCPFVPLPILQALKATQCNAIQCNLRKVHMNVMLYHVVPILRMIDLSFLNVIAGNPDSDLLVVVARFSTLGWLSGSSLGQRLWFFSS